MADSLRDQLVKAGLATSAQAKQAERQKRAESQARRKSKDKAAATATDTDKARQRARQQNADKAKKDRELANVRNQKYAAKALRAEIKQIILQNDQRNKTTSEEDVPYNFVHGKKIKRVYVPATQKAQLIAGSLVIVNNDGLYHFVSKSVAQQIAERDPNRIIVAHEDKPADASEDDEYYAKFAVPDDLDW